MMVEKRITLPEETLEALARQYEVFGKEPRSRLRLAEAISDAVHRLEACENERISISKTDAEYLEDLIHFGVYSSKETAVREAIKLLRAKKADEVKALFEKRLGI